MKFFKRSYDKKIEALYLFEDNIFYKEKLLMSHLPAPGGIRNVLHRAALYDKKVGNVKALARNLAQRGVELELPVSRSGKKAVLPTSTWRSAHLALYEAGLSNEERLSRINDFLEIANRIKIGDMMVGRLYLWRAVEQYEKAVSDLKGEGQFTSEMSLSLVKDALDHHTVIPSEREITAKLDAMMGVLTSTDETITIQKLSALIVDTIQKDWKTGNPNIMLLDTDEHGNKFLIPTEIAMPPFVKKWGQRLRGINLGEHRIPVTIGSENIYVQAFLKGADVFEKDISFEKMVKLASDFIDARITEGGKYSKLFKTVFFSRKNNLLMRPLVHKGRKLGLITIFKEPGFTQQELHEITMFINLAAFVLAHRQVQESLNESVRQLKETARQLQEMQASLIEKERLAATGEMAAMISHTFKNLLSGASGLNDEQRSLINRVPLQLDIVRIRMSIGLPIDRELESLSQTVEGMLELINLNQGVLVDGQRTVRGILSMAKAGGEKEQALFLKEYLGEILEIFKLQAKQNEMRLIVDLSGIDESDGINIAQKDLGDLLQNLIRNAFEAFSDNGYTHVGSKEVRITVRREENLNGPHVVFEIKDNGCGIPADMIPILFTTPGMTSKGSRGGHGWGMPTVKRIADKVRAEIRVDSKQGQGTKFEIKFKRVEAKKAVKRRAERVSRVSDLPLALISSKCIVLVEDEEILRRAHQRTLKGMGFSNIHFFVNAEEAFAQIQSGEVTPDLIISDESLPGMKGHQFLIRLDSWCRENEIPMPKCIINSGVGPPGGGSAVGQTLIRLGVTWIIKGLESSTSMQEAIARFFKPKAMKDVVIGKIVNGESLDNPFYGYVLRLTHKLNNPLTVASNSIVKDDLELKEFWENGTDDLINLFEQIQAFVKAVTDKEFASQGINKLPPALSADTDFIEIWNKMSVGQKADLAVLSKFLLREVAENIKVLKELREKDMADWEENDFREARGVLDSIDRQAKAAQLRGEAPREKVRWFRSLYKLFGEDRNAD